MSSSMVSVMPSPLFIASVFFCARRMQSEVRDMVASPRKGTLAKVYGRVRGRAWEACALLVPRPSAGMHTFSCWTSWSGSMADA